MVLASVAFYYDFNSKELMLLAILTSLSATCGRLLLALWSSKVARRKLLSEEERLNLDVIRQRLHSKPLLASGFIFLYAMSPFPSGQFFLAYGLSNLSLKLAIVPFFLGRYISYVVWVYSSSRLSDSINIEQFQSGTWFGVWFVITQLAGLFLVYLFTKVNWRSLILRKK